MAPPTAGCRQRLPPVEIPLPQPLPSVTLILGGARSGKSAHAEALVLGSGRRPVYLATAQALDAEMAERVRQHRQRRAADWLTVEEPLELPRALAAAAGTGPAALVGWLTPSLPHPF